MNTKFKTGDRVVLNELYCGVLPGTHGVVTGVEEGFGEDLIRVNFFRTGEIPAIYASRLRLRTPKPVTKGLFKVMSVVKLINGDTVLKELGVPVTYTTYNEAEDHMNTLINRVGNTTVEFAVVKAVSRTTVKVTREINTEKQP